MKLKAVFLKRQKKKIYKTLTKHIKEKEKAPKNQKQKRSYN